MMKKVGVAILGLGVVGGGTYKILTEHREFYQRTQNVDIEVENVLVRNREKARALGVPEAVYYTQLRRRRRRPEESLRDGKRWRDW